MGDENQQQQGPSSPWQFSYVAITYLWGRLWGRILVVVVGCAALVVGALCAKVNGVPAMSIVTGWYSSSKPNTPLKVAIFFPDPSAEGGAAKDGAIQSKGIQRAIAQFKETHVDYPEPLQGNFTLPLKRDADLFPRIQHAYDDGYRIFVVTMSTAMFHLHDRFGTWYRKLEKEGKPLPVLVGTVASAPDLADAAGGIYRLYIRSEEEAAELARFAKWSSQVDFVGVFLITHDANARTDRYGAGGFETFEHEFKDLGGTTGEYKVLDNASNAPQRVRDFIAAAKSRRSGAFIVGYSGMIRATIEELARQHFNGPIFCASTLTEPTWQPVDTSLDANIVTVTPHRDDAVSPNDDEHGTVFFFSEYTLLRVFRCAMKAKDTREFQVLWQQDDDTGYKIMHLANGDAIVPLTVTREWRPRGN